MRGFTVYIDLMSETFRSTLYWLFDSSLILPLIALVVSYVGITLSLTDFMIQ
jgi:hypothetical protein